MLLFLFVAGNKCSLGIWYIPCDATWCEIWWYS